MTEFGIRRWNLLLAAALFGAATLAAQPPQGGPGPGGGMGPGPGRRQGGGMQPGRGPMEANRPPVERMFGGVPQGRWWADPATIQRLGLTADQQKQIEAVFQANRPKLIDLNASLQKEEVALEPLLDADTPDQAKILPAIDRVAEARAELEKANARMLLGFRGTLSKDQWNKLQAGMRPEPPRGGPLQGGPPPRNGGRE
ncbi:MAG TPA: periplasmic heavy metal sensor [Bryobacteraceae bacterium]|nr:periplasmic heavy metal sensor [Bryobacteraceae bacterium]